MPYFGVTMGSSLSSTFSHKYYLRRGHIFLGEKFTLNQKKPTLNKILRREGTKELKKFHEQIKKNCPGTKLCGIIKI